MATVLLALGRDPLREACRQFLAEAGHAAVVAERPLAVLTLASNVGCVAACVDDSALGRGALTAIAECERPMPVIGVGLSGAGVATSLRLPLVGDDLVSALDQVTARAGGGARLRHAGGLTLDRGRRTAAAGGREVALTRTQLRILEVLIDHRPREAPTPELLRLVWGYGDGEAETELVRSHVRNLRSRLADLGLADAIRARRGRGYALTL